MAFINWTEDLSVKIPSIDEQHKKIIDMLNDFYDNIENRSNDEHIAVFVEGLKEYAGVHFTTEEKYMAELNFPAYIEHKVEHDLFVSKVCELEVRFTSGKLMMTFEITRFIKDWIKKHIQETDKLYSDFLIERGVK